MKKIYLIKSVSPWMVEELLSLADLTEFKLVFIRKPDKFYQKDIKYLKNKGVKVYNNPIGRVHLSRLPFVTLFLMKNLRCFFQSYSAVIGLKSIGWFLRLKQHLFESDSIHAQFATQATLLAWMIKEFNKKDRQTTYSFTYHAYDIYFNNLWFSKLVNNAEHAFSISEYNIDYVKKMYTELDASKLILSRLGTKSPPPCISEKVGNSFRLGFISWFVPKKGLFYLMEAMKKLNAKNLNIRLILAGDGPLKKDILSFIEKNDLEAHVDYVGKIGKQEKHNFFCSLDALVLPAITVPNDQDGIPVVLMEAISYGLPIISTTVSGIPEICIDDYNGKLVPEKNQLALLSAIEELYLNAKKRDQFSKNSKIIFRKYDIEKNTRTKKEFMKW